MQHFHYDTLDSTNKEAGRLAMTYGNNFYVTATTQSHGIGKDQRSWISPQGNLYFSLAYHLLKPVQAVQLTFVTAVVVADLVVSLLPHTTINCKWPNDILVNNAKLAGILLELQDNLLISGIGVNISNYPHHTSNFPATCLQQHNSQLQLTPDALATDLVEHLTTAYNSWQQYGFNTYRQRWLDYAYHLGKTITINNYGAGDATAALTGIFQGINTDGALILLDAQQQQHLFYSADVSYESI